MKIGDLKIIHIVLAVAIVLWAFLFYDWQRTKYQLQFEAWRNQVSQAINHLGKEVNDLKNRQAREMIPQQEKKRGP